MNRWWFAAVPIVVGVVYWPVLGFGWLEWDDDVYVTGNAAVLAGLTPRGAREAFTSFACSNWHPLAILSHMLDVSLFGTWAGGHHLSNVVLHGLNAVLVGVLAWRLTARWPESLLVATLVAVHPQRVESVAWVSERKDVLCGLFFLVSLLAYLRFARTADHRERGIWYATALGSGILACLAKPMAVTLPLVLLLLDGWPLGRVAGVGTPWRRRVAACTRPGCGWAMMVEKAPFFVMSLLTAALTMRAQEAAQASVAAVPIGVRGVNAIVAYATYVRRSVWPTRLAALYPHPAGLVTFGDGAGISGESASASLTSVEIASAIAVLGIVTAGAVALARPRAGRAMPWLAFGWAWFLVMLVPVIGLVQVGSQATADRYYYLPGFGLEFGIVMTVGEAVRRNVAWRHSQRRPLTIAAGGGSLAVVVIFAILAHRQVRTWRSDETLWRHAAVVVPQNAIAESLLASALAAQGRAAEAIEHHLVALRLEPALRESLANLGLLLSDGGQPAAALPYLTRACRLWPRDADMGVNLAICLARLGQTDDARNAFLQAVAQAPDNARHRYNFAIFLDTSGDRAAALRELDVALACDPAFAPARAARRRMLADGAASSAPADRERAAE